MPFWSRPDPNDPPRHLPLPTGPHAVGYQDVMTAGPAEDGVFCRLYYPSALPLQQTTGNHSLWPLWSDDDYLVGFVKFMQAMLARWPSWAPRGEFLYIDQVAYIAPIMHLGCTHVWKLLNGRVFCPILKNAKISRERKWPLVVFSHGMGCSRFAYSRICTDLASHGFIVAATEHRDGSAALSFTMERGSKVWIQHRRVGEDEKEYSVRNSQLQMRTSEVIRTLNLMEELDKGSNVSNVLEDRAEMDLTMFKDTMDISNPIMAGHSYGGATTLMALSKDSRFKQGIVLDGWLFPIKDEKIKMDQPIVFINTQSFMSRHNIAKMKTFLTGNISRKMVFIKGSVHQNHIDAPLIFKDGIIKKIIGMQSETDPILVLNLNDKLMLHFMSTNLGLTPNRDVVDYLEQNQSLLIEASDKDDDSAFKQFTDSED